MGLLALALSWLTLLTPAPARGQAGATPPTPASVPAPTTSKATAVAADSASGSRAEALRVFLDCQDFGFGCELDYFVLELPFANWTRDRQFADVHVLVSRLETGGGGREFTLSFLGQGRFAGRVDTLVTTTPPAATEDDVRRALATELRVGLLPFAVRTPLRSRFTVAYAAPTQAQATAKSLKDPWNLWTYELSVNGFMNGEQRQKFSNGWYSAEARRITERWKLVFAASGNYNQSEFTLQDRTGASTKFTNILRSAGASGRVVRSLDPHWSFGVVSRVGNSDFLNQELAYSAAPVVEYNVFPWKEATRKQLTFSYAAGLAGFRYKERTIFERDAETRPVHVATASLNTRLKWGSINARSRFGQFLHDVGKSNLSVGGNVSLRLVKGLSLNLDGEVARVRDQLFLPGGQLTNEEVLVRQRALATNYSYFTFVGVTYTFGSIFNTIVNPRLDNFALVRF